MKINKFSTYPNKSKQQLFWQLEIIPSITILRMKDYEFVEYEWHSNYINIIFSWLFWSIELNINLNKDDSSN